MPGPALHPVRGFSVLLVLPLFALSGCLGDAVYLAWEAKQAATEAADDGPVVSAPDLVFHGTLEPSPGNTLQNVHQVPIDGDVRRVVVAGTIETAGRFSFGLCKEPSGFCFDRHFEAGSFRGTFFDLHLQGLPSAWPDFKVEADDHARYSFYLVIDPPEKGT